jgi:hypothetical protein
MISTVRKIRGNDMDLPSAILIHCAEIVMLPAVSCWLVAGGAKNHTTPQCELPVLLWREVSAQDFMIYAKKGKSTILSTSANNNDIITKFLQIY